MHETLECFVVFPLLPVVKPPVWTVRDCDSRLSPSPVIAAFVLRSNASQGVVWAARAALSRSFPASMNHNLIDRRTWEGGRWLG